MPLPAECGECVKERPKKASRGAVPPHHWQLHLSVPRIGHATCGEKLTARVRVEALREGKERKVGCTIARSKTEREGPGWARGYGASSLNSIAGSHGHEPWLGIQKSRESCQGAPVFEREFQWEFSARRTGVAATLELGRGGGGASGVAVGVAYLGPDAGPRGWKLEEGGSLVVEFLSFFCAIHHLCVCRADLRIRPPATTYPLPYGAGLVVLRVW